MNLLVLPGFVGEIAEPITVPYLLNKIREIAQAYITKGEDVDPAIIVHRGTKIEIIHVGKLFDSRTQHGKDILASIMKGMIREPEVTLVVLAVEAWMVYKDGEPIDEDITAGSIATHPDRQEVVFITIMHKYKDDQWYLPIDHTALKGQEVGEAKQFGRPGGVASGRFVREDGDAETLQ